MVDTAVKVSDPVLDAMSVNPSLSKLRDFDGHEDNEFDTEDELELLEETAPTQAPPAEEINVPLEHETEVTTSPLHSPPASVHDEDHKPDEKVVTDSEEQSSSEQATDATLTKSPPLVLLDYGTSNYFLFVSGEHVDEDGSANGKELTLFNDEEAHRFFYNDLNAFMDHLKRELIGDPEAADVELDLEFPQLGCSIHEASADADHTSLENVHDVWRVYAKHYFGSDEHPLRIIVRQCMQLSLHLGHIMSDLQDRDTPTFDQQLSSHDQGDYNDGSDGIAKQAATEVVVIDDNASESADTTTAEVIDSETHMAITSEKTHDLTTGSEHPEDALTIEVDDEQTLLTIADELDETEGQNIGAEEAEEAPSQTGDNSTHTLTATDAQPEHLEPTPDIDFDIEEGLTTPGEVKVANGDALNAELEELDSSSAFGDDDSATEVMETHTMSTSKKKRVGDPHPSADIDDLDDHAKRIRR